MDFVGRGLGLFGEFICGISGVRKVVVYSVSVASFIMFCVVSESRRFSVSCLCSFRSRRVITWFFFRYFWIREVSLV